MKVCKRCGYGHLASSGSGPDTCSSCGTPLQIADEINRMVRLQNVTVKRVEQITSDEEERQRIGYEIQTAYRFSDISGCADVQIAEIKVAGQLFATIRYGDAAQIWRINLGWRHRKKDKDCGFPLDVERGYWGTNKDADESDAEDPMSKRIKNVIPYVEDHRNVLTVKFTEPLDEVVMASLQAAFIDQDQIHGSQLTGALVDRLNAGHDLDLHNLPQFATVPGLLEVSIGHALTVDAISMGLAKTVAAYQRALGKQ